MKTVLTLLAFVVAVHSQCNVPTYTQNLVHTCNTSTSRIKMPYYQNVTQYYTCSNSNSVVATCPPSTPYFSYVLQTCCSCNDYIPAVPCSDLTLPNKPSCTSISSSTTTTTTARPTTSTSTTTRSPIPTPALNSTTTTTTSRTPTLRPTSAPGTGATPPSPGTVVTPPGPGTGIVGPPSPATSNPNLVTPPTPMPTPPNIPDQPPFVNNPPVTG